MLDAATYLVSDYSTSPTSSVPKPENLYTPGVRTIGSEQRKSEAPPMLTPSAACVAELPHQWSLIMARPRRPKALAWDLIERDLPYFLPLVEIDRALIPMFDGYLFVCGHDASDFCRRSQHVCKVQAIESKAAQARLVSDLSSIELVLFRNRKLNISPVKFIGQRVRVNSGAYEGTEGYVKSFGSRGPVASVVMEKMVMMVFGCRMLGLGDELEVERKNLEPIERV